MNDAFLEAVRGCLLFAGFIVGVFAVFGCFRFWQVFIRPARARRKRRR